MTKFEDFFTPVDEIRQDEPNYGKPTNVPPMDSKVRGDLASFLNKTPLQLLEEGCVAAYQEKVNWLMQQYEKEFEMTCQLRGVKGVGRHVSKKTAKQKAAVDFLRKIVKKGNYKEFYIPGSSEEEAMDAMDQLEKSEEARKNGETSPSTPVKAKEIVDDIPTSDKLSDASVDWIGKLQELIHKIKMPTPTYACSEEGDPMNRKFMITCTVGKQTTRGISTTKKTSKKISAHLMFNILENGVEMMESELLDNDDENQDWMKSDEAQRLKQIEEKCLKEKDAEAALKTLLSDSKRFSKFQMNYKLPSMNTIGFKQVMLEIEVSAILPSDEDELEMGAEHTQTEEIAKASAQKDKERKKVMDGGPFVFGGSGATERDAEQNACQSALIHFNTYEF